jgi:hypothetical protein
MKTRIPLIALMLCAIVVPSFAQYVPPQYTPPPQSAPLTFSQQDLDRMLAPVALYPDSLLTQILMASTYPVEVRQAAQWLRSNPGLAGEQATRLAAQSSWDPSVQSLTAFPQIVQMMDENMQWTENLGEAFLAQQPYVMDTVQSLRRRAWAAGTLRNDGHVLVSQQGPVIVIEPAQPQLVYVPYYDPLVVYGPWWYPAYPPVRWRPWPGYYAGPGVSVGLYWGPAITVSAGIFFGRFDWGRRNVTIVNEYAPHREVRIVPAQRAWAHAPEHRREAPFRNEEVRRQFQPQRVQEQRVVPAPERRTEQRVQEREEPRRAEPQVERRIERQEPRRAEPQVERQEPRREERGGTVRRGRED